MVLQTAAQQQACTLLASACGREQQQRLSNSREVSRVCGGCLRRLRRPCV